MKSSQFRSGAFTPYPTKTSGAWAMATDGWPVSAARTAISLPWLSVRFVPADVIDSSGVPTISDLSSGTS